MLCCRVSRLPEGACLREGVKRGSQRVAWGGLKRAVEGVARRQWRADGHQE